ncbi:atherin-like [Ailuropoda melanoleuca]|uniref:atherin-like n=1 Tax=Ailuropoda melanoleuca TaxID=9646 RepID=UPI0014941E00|nr:atherin-like [Ailuropoda melanoleuca]
MREHRGTGAQAATARVVARKLSTPIVDLPAWARSGWSWGRVVAARVQRGREELPPAAQLLSKAARARQGDISETRRGRPRTGLGPSPPCPQPGGCDPQHRLTAATPKPPSLQAMDGVRDPKPSASVIRAQRPPLPTVWLPPRASTHQENPQSSSLSLPLPPPPQTPNPRPLS